MRFEGRLAVWNGERGYGAIASEQGGQELFVHVSAFPRDGAPPAVGEALSFEVVSGGDGRKQAARVLRLTRVAPPAPAGFMAPALQRRRLQAAQRKRRLVMSTVALALLVSVVGWLQVKPPHAERVAQVASGSRVNP